MSQSVLSTQNVWAELGDRLRRYFRARVADAATTDDLVQETFLRIHQHLEALADEARLAPWVFQIARNVVIDHYRAKKRSAITLGDTDELTASTSDTGEPDFNAKIAAWLPAAIELLPENQRDVVRRFELQGVSQKEIAEQMGISLTAVKSRIRRGRAALIQIVDQCCVFELDRRGNILDYDLRNGCC